MSKRIKGFTCCGDCVHYNYKKHKCNLGASIETDARNPFYDDCPIPDIPNDKEIRDKAIEEFAEKVKNLICEHTYPYFDKDGEPVSIWNADGYKEIDKLLCEIAEQMKEVNL